MLYHKIEGPFKRDQNNIKKVDRALWRNGAVQMLAESPIWVGSEKIDGTNIRIIWDGHRVALGGRTERAELPGGLRLYLEGKFLAPGVEEVFEELFGDSPAILFGEGYGPKIQNGGKYRDTPGFIAFDVKVGDTYLDRTDAKQIATRVGAEFVPETAPTTLTDLIGRVSAGLQSEFGEFEAEGYVAVTQKPLYDQRGNRIIVKVKTADLKEN